MPSLLQLAQVEQKYDEKTVLKDFNLTLDLGEIGCLLGPSGCGKTTVLRCIAGFEMITQGNIKLAEETISSSTQHTPAHQRNIGMLFQDYALFPHLTVQENIAFGLIKQTKSAQKERVAYLLDLINMSHYSNQFPHKLSGGQQQRVALARSLAPKPNLLLLDEPFSSLDPDLREKLAQELRQILKHESMSAIMVSHEQNEAFAFADKIGVMHDGQLLQWADALTLYQYPNNLRVAQFIGESNILKAKVISENKVTTEVGSTTVTLPSGVKVNDEVQILLRPNSIGHIVNSPHRATIIDKKFYHGQALNTIKLASGQILTFTSQYHQHLLNEEINIAIIAQDLIAFKTRQTHKEPQ